MGLGPQGVSSGLSGELLTFNKKELLTAEDLETERLNLVKRKQEIDVKLANKNMSFDDGTRMAPKTYHTYRQGLVEEKTNIDMRLSEVKRKLKEIRLKLLSENPSDIIKSLREIQKLLFSVIDALEKEA